MWVRESLVLPSAQRKATGTLPSALIVRMNSSCLRSGRWSFENPKVIAGALRWRIERPEAALYLPQKLTDVLSLWNSSNFTPKRLPTDKLGEALALVQTPHVCQPGLLRSIALKLPKARHAEAVPLLLRVFAVTMPASSTPYRDELELVKELVSRMAQPESNRWLALLRAEYKAKRNFIKGLDAIRIPA